MWHAGHRYEGLHAFLDPRWSVYGQRFGPPGEAHSLQQSRQSEDMIAVQVGYQYGPYLHEREWGDHQLSLRSLSAVHEDYVGTVPYGDAGCRTVPGRDAGTCAEEEQFQHVIVSIVDGVEFPVRLGLLLELLVVFLAQMDVAQVVALELEL